MPNMDDISNHFNEEAAEYDGLIKNLIPYYHEMVSALVHALPFAPSDDFSFIDLGCGTATLSKAIVDQFKNARPTCLDIAPNMLQMARQKLSHSPSAMFIHSNFEDFAFDNPYDAVVSSLALHHLETLDDKFNFIKKIHSALPKGGVFVNADIVLGTNNTLQQQYLQQWKRYMCRTVSTQEVEEKWLVMYEKEDRPITLMQHLDMLRSAGFTTLDIVWKYYNFAVIMAQK